LKLRITNLSKSFGVHRALDGVSLTVENLHSLVLIGPSGGGKTTLLRVLAGLEQPETGEIEWSGQRMQFDETGLLRHRRSVGMVFQAFNLFPHLTALENITLPLEKVHDYSRLQARERALELLNRFGLDKHADQKPSALSGGQRQRVALARAVAFKPRVLLCDEPTSALDPEMTAEVLDMLRQVIDEGCDVILATHVMGFARVVADRVVFLAGGRIVETGDAPDFFDAPATEQCRRFLATVLKY
jgi:polar amino acid transport system ATP-binding protein